MSRSYHIAVIGTSVMGHGLAQIFAVSGNEVFIFDVDSEVLKNAKDKTENNLKFFAENGIGASEEIPLTLKRIQLVRGLPEAISDVRFVIEAVVKKLEVKQDLFATIEEHCSPLTTQATNTSVVGIAEIASKCRRKDRAIGTHFWNPPYFVLLVEVIRGRETSDGALDCACQLYKSAREKPVKFNKDEPWFIGNRLQHALLREAVSIVGNGIAESEMVDEVVKSGFCLRLPVPGPLQNSDMVGLDLTFQVHDYILSHIERSPGPSRLLREERIAGELGFKTRQGFYKWDRQSIGAMPKAAPGSPLRLEP